MSSQPMDLWHQGRVLIAGDSRVRRLQSIRDPLLVGNVDFAFSGGIMIEDLVTLVDEKISDEHHIVILLGFIGDEVQHYCHPVDIESSVTLYRSRESEPSQFITESVKKAHTKWMALKPDRIIVWTIPYYLDYATYNTAKIGEYDVGDTESISWDSSLRFVHFVNRLCRQWVTTMPNVPFSLLNKVLFSSQRHTELFQTFGSLSGADFQFPAHALTDGVHPSATLTQAIWKFLLQSVAVVYRKSLPGTSTEKIDDNQQVDFLPVSSVASRGGASSFKRYSKPMVKTPLLKTHSFKKGKKPYSRPASVHSRISYEDKNDTVEELIKEYPAGNYGNLSWRASTDHLSQPSTSSARPESFHEGFAQPWSWSFHHKTVAATKASIFTQGVQEQKWAEGQLASIIREGGLKAARAGQLTSINNAFGDWAERTRSVITNPHSKSRMTQSDVKQLVAIQEEDREKDSESLGNEEEEEDLNHDVEEVD
ncbi:unnamed protein product [Rotaria magnacalcarata]|uniref:Uncharacterized protein n=1 Tax=Rotaria magnacalcarata TaxID=392030 RepID=A0A816S6J7_9BILA|nr:unnamed protein product [Rotaria magnacalcarata]CAF4300963.1 unnamed protein product [Rotaria magnacalcarata]